MSEHHHTHESVRERVLGVTHDPAVRPAGILITIVGLIWSMFAYSASDAGSYGQPVCAVILIIIGASLARFGKPMEQI